MNQKEYDEKLEMLEKEIAELKKVKIETNNSRRKRLKRYYTISSNGIIKYLEDKYDIYDNFLYDVRNYYPTFEEAEKAKRKMILIQSYKDFVDEINVEEIEWDNRDQEKYCIFYVVGDNRLIQDFVYTHSCQGTIYSTNKSLLELVEKRFTKEELKIIIGIE